MSLKQFRTRFQEKLKMVEQIPRTYEEMCLEKLKEIGISSVAEWSLAMGYKSPNGLSKVIKRIKERMPEKIIIHYNKKPRKYEAL
ncbi:MAG: hypothetical protein ACFE9S_09000 [Candidatus Hermodarchaeota archaeon]